MGKWDVSSKPGVNGVSQGCSLAGIDLAGSAPKLGVLLDSRGWDADQDGLMEGCQHNTMDVEYLGPNPQMQGWYLAALDAAADMAEAMHDSEFAKRCRDLATAGAARMEADLFEDGWYRQRIQPLAADAIAAGLRIGMSDMDPADPELQLGDGCLIDQLIGPVVAGIAGLPHRLDAQHVAATNASILKHNRQTGFHAHFNPFRCYASADDEAVLMAAYPDRVTRPERPFPYYGEVMTGFEYSFALQLLQSDERTEAERVVAAIRARHSGSNRNPFDEIECGHHYVRAMASWGLFNAWTGLGCDHRHRQRCCRQRYQRLDRHRYLGLDPSLRRPRRD